MGDLEKELNNLDNQLKKQNDMLDMVMDLFAEAGDLRFAFTKKSSKFYKKLGKIATNENITNEQFEQLINLLDQFEQIINDNLKEG